MGVVTVVITLRNFNFRSQKRNDPREMGMVWARLWRLFGKEGEGTKTLELSVFLLNAFDASNHVRRLVQDVS